jgi:hypothetical protein
MRERDESSTANGGRDDLSLSMFVERWSLMEAEIWPEQIRLDA